MSSISIVVLTCNRRESLRESLEHLDTLADRDCEVIVVDNGSRDGTPEMVRAHFPRVVCESLPENIGVGARNQGLRRARGKIVICLDDDILGLSDADLAYLRSVFAGNAQLGAVNFRVTHYSSGRVCDWVHHRRIEDADLTFLTYEITEGAVAFRGEALAAAGFYCADFFISHEGLDLAYRIMNAGYHLIYDGRVTVRHKHDRSGRSDWRRHYYDTRNLFWVAARNQPIGYALRYLSRGLGAMAIYSLRDGTFLYWLRAVRDGLLRVPQMLRARVPWSTGTRELCRLVDAQRPGFWYLARKRVAQQGFKMD